MLSQISIALPDDDLLSIYYVDAPWQAAAGINLAAVNGIDAFRSAVAVILRE